jgi:hypothetical protein
MFEFTWQELLPSKPVWGGVLRCDGGCVVRERLLQCHYDLRGGLCRGQQFLAMHIEWCMVEVKNLSVEYQSGFVGGG